jgi:putative endonuclease
LATPINIERRLYEHNLGKEKFTSKGIPWVLKVSKSFESNIFATKEELRLKKCKSRKYLESYIITQLVEHPDI